MDRRSFVKKAGAAGHRRRRDGGHRGGDRRRRRARGGHRARRGRCPPSRSSRTCATSSGVRSPSSRGHARRRIGIPRWSSAWSRPPARRRGWSRCRPIAKRPRSARTRLPTTPTSTRSSARTSPTPSRSSPTTSRWRARTAARTSSSSETTSCTRSTSTTTATPSPTSSTTSGSTRSSATPTRSSTTPGRSGRSTTRTGTGASSTRSPAAAATARTEIGKGLASPPCNIGPRSTPNYAALAQAAVHHLPSGETVFAGQRNDGFFVDLGAIFDLGDLRPFQNLHLIPTPATASVDSLQDAERAHHRDPGADQAPDPRRLQADRPVPGQGRARHLGRAPAAAG